MNFTNTGFDTAGRIYDVNETARLEDFANTFNTLSENADKNDTKKKDTIRYVVIVVGSLVVLGLFAFLTRKK
jgi:hypothetical protein